MSTIRVQATMERTSRLPEDRVVNTFHFQTPGAPTPAEFDAIRGVLDTFYYGTAGVAESHIRANVHNKTVGQPKYLMYDLAQSMPRERVERASLRTEQSNSTSAFPAELAACVSFFAGRNLPRRRGRLYIGPLATSTADQATGEHDARVNNATRNILVTAARRLRDNSQAAGVPWVVWSTMDKAAHVITAGWVDNGFDVQRRRGAKPSVRETFGA